MKAGVNLVTLVAVLALLAFTGLRWQLSSSSTTTTTTTTSSSSSSFPSGAVLQGTRQVNAKEIFGGSQLKNNSVYWSVNLIPAKLARRQLAEGLSDCDRYGYSHDCSVTCAQYTKETRSRECARDNCCECSWLGDECRNTEDVTCPDINMPDPCKDFGGCSWVWSPKGGECMESDKVTCADLSTKLACKEHDGCAWVGWTNGDCRDEDSISCSDIAESKRCKQKDGCVWRRGPTACMERPGSSY